MAATLYYSRNPNPRLAVAVARYLDAPVTLEWCSPFDPGRASYFLSLNPTQRIPILVENGVPLWEADAIACRLSQMTESNFWRGGAELPDMIRWLSWGKESFVRACDMVHYELGTKQRYNHGPADPAKLAEGNHIFLAAAHVLDGHMSGRDWILGRTPSYANFRMASFLPFNDVAQLPVSDFPNLQAWSGRLGTLPFWTDPFCRLACAVFAGRAETSGTIELFCNVRCRRTSAGLKKGLSANVTASSLGQSCQHPLHVPHAPPTTPPCSDAPRRKLRRYGP